MALEPDNQMHQLSTVLGQMLSPTSRLTALVSVSLLTQDEKFLPLSATTTITSLPRTSLDGEVWIMRGQLKLTSRPMHKLQLSAQYSCDERDNKTATADYDYFVGETTGQVHPICHRIARFLERQGLLERDMEQSYLTLQEDRVFCLPLFSGFYLL